MCFDVNMIPFTIEYMPFTVYSLISLLMANTNALNRSIGFDNPVREENLHVRFSESRPNVVGTQSNGFAGTKASDNAGQARKETKPIKDYILLPLWTADPPFSQDPKCSHVDRSKPSIDDEKKVDEDLKSYHNVNSLTVNAAGTNEDNEFPFDPSMPALEDVSIFNFSSDDENDGTMADMNNLDTATKNKKDERGIVIRNKARLVAQGYIQEERIDYDEVFAPIARIEAIRLFLAYASFKNFMVYQMDAKSAFLYGKIEEEVYVCQPPGFEDPDFPDRVYKVEKSLYGIHQAPRAWYETLSTYLLDNGFQRGKIDKTLFIKRHKDNILLVQVYVDDNIFGLQVKQKKDGIFISQDKYVAKILKKFRFTEVKNASIPMETQKPLLKDKDGEEVDVHMYRYQINPKVSHLHAVKRIFSMVAFLSKPTESDGFEKIVDFLTAHPIRYALTVNPTVYISCIEQLWSTAMTKTINMEVRIHARVDGKEIVITESSVRRDLQLADEEGIYCLPNSTIFEQPALMGVTPLFPTMVIQNQSEMGEGSAMPTDSHHTPTILQPSSFQPQKTQKPRKPKRKDTRVLQPSGPIESVVDEDVHKQLSHSLVRAATTASSLETEQDSGGGPRCQETMGDTTTQTRFEGVSKHSNDSLLARGNTLRSDEDSMKLNDLIELYTNLQKGVHELEKTKTTQQNEIDSLKRRVKKLEKRNKSTTHKLKRLYKVGLKATYIDTRPNGEALRKCILSGPYKRTTILVQVVEAIDDSPAVPEHTTVETPMNMSPENKANFLAKKEAIHLILTGIGDEIYSTVDACQTTQELWEAIERLQQGESLNIQDVKTNLFWEFDKFTSHDGESMESYYTRFYKLMNEMIKNNLTVTTM
nr:hypothetical protein [Tanacetum cinerariifolium]